MYKEDRPAEYLGRVEQLRLWKRVRNVQHTVGITDLNSCVREIANENWSVPLPAPQTEVVPQVGEPVDLCLCPWWEGRNEPGHTIFAHAP